MINLFWRQYFMEMRSHWQPIKLSDVSIYLTLTFMSLEPFIGLSSTRGNIIKCHLILTRRKQIHNTKNKLKLHVCIYIWYFIFLKNFTITLGNSTICVTCSELSVSGYVRPMLCVLYMCLRVVPNTLIKYGI